MKTVQYTIPVPKNVDDYLRRQATRRKQSLNTTVLDYIQKTIDRDQASPDDDYSWLIGSNTIDNDSLAVIQESKHYDKQKQRQQ